jgi:hypothetical protein
MIDFFSNDDLRTILELLKSNQEKNPNEMLEKFIAASEAAAPVVVTEISEDIISDDDSHLIDDRTPEEVKQAEEDADLYSIRNFSL